MEPVRPRNDRDGCYDHAKGRHFASPYPHTTTVQQWFDWEKFEAYRILGYQMASTYIKKSPQDLGKCAF